MLTQVVAPKFEEFSNTYTDAIFLKCVGDSSPDATKLMKREGIRSVSPLSLAPARARSLFFLVCAPSLSRSRST